jgi:hypothetical protein
VPVFSYYRSLGARFDLAFAEFADRDSEFKVRVQGIESRAAWWRSHDLRRHARFLGGFSRDAGLFGGAAGTTCACDATKDGVTNPAPVNGNARPSLSADDDGGFFRARARAYYRRGAITVAYR